MQGEGLRPRVRDHRNESRVLCSLNRVTTTTTAAMATSMTDLSSYRDQHFKVSVKNTVCKTELFHNGLAHLVQGSRNEQDRLLKQSACLYVGNMSFYTTEEQLYELFGKCGDVKRIVMGLDKFKRTPCGFCFVEYYSREDALNAMAYVNGTRYAIPCYVTEKDY